VQPDLPKYFFYDDEPGKTGGACCWVALPGGSRPAAGGLGGGSGHAYENRLASRGQHGEDERLPAGASKWRSRAEPGRSVSLRSSLYVSGLLAILAGSVLASPGRSDVAPDFPSQSTCPARSVPGLAVAPDLDCALLAKCGVSQC
jgi:hypothetical protein